MFEQTIQKTKQNFRNWKSLSELSVLQHELFDRREETVPTWRSFKCQFGFVMEVQRERLLCSPDLCTSQPEVALTDSSPKNIRQLNSLDNLPVLRGTTCLFVLYCFHSGGSSISLLWAAHVASETDEIAVPVVYMVKSAALVAKDLAR